MVRGHGPVDCYCVRVPHFPQTLVLFSSLVLPFKQASGAEHSLACLGCVLAVVEKLHLAVTIAPFSSFVRFSCLAVAVGAV